ncbi:MAG: bifunctional 2-C-methyl-D-erythritol 4-phosphate cytidylyltransferase/2-C-methyl-D-erythritol 2,4-cyclodiphosphate synthase [Campylobacterales bacterium]|nr:bifunctional 2-C-methyl-D-erythritol 4-phosphate cytidylyltransferase/2-C-methyl-D-erythritol 2,4-cyclodiphosphate synthase [Campylobacterales bacterium]
MSDLTLILLAAGNSARFTSPVKKQWLRIGHQPLWHFVTNEFTNLNIFSKVIITAHKDEIAYMRSFCEHTIVEGGQTRQASLKNALSHVSTPYVMVSDIARSCPPKDLIMRLMGAKEKADCIIPVLGMNDTVSFDGRTIDREKLKRIQTPQLSKSSVLKEALNTTEEYTDESSAILAFGKTRFEVEGDESAHKLTRISDMKNIPCLRPPSSDTLIGNGFDVHAFEEGKPMFLGGVQIDSNFGFKAHSDGDVAIHSLIDALLGAAGMGDIGTLFPDSDAGYKGIDSKLLLKETVNRLHHCGFTIVNVDITIIAETPRLSEYKTQMRRTLAAILEIEPFLCNIKATTTEGLGFTGRKEGVAVQSSASVKYLDWTTI